MIASSSYLDEADDQVTPITSSIRKQHQQQKQKQPTTTMSSPSSGGTATTTTDSARSFGSHSTAGTGGSSTTTPTPGLRDNLMRRQKEDRDPAIFYTTIKVLGMGSMGHVAKVKKKDSAVGGSSRANYVSQIHGMEGFCFSLPLIGGILRSCTGKNLGHRVKKNLFVESPSSLTNSSNNKDASDRTSRHFGRSSSSIISHNSRKDIYYALKTIIVDRVQNPVFLQELYNEIDILKTLDHPNIVRPIETYNFNNNACIVMELCEGGDLFARDPYTEGSALQIVTSVLSAIEYMHSKNIVHRDLKFENIMFCDKSPNSDVKVIDFGLSKKYLPSDRLQDGVGTVYSMAPEVLRGDYNQSADLWSLGVIAFMLLSSAMPFYGKDPKAVVNKVLAGKYYMRGLKWQKTSWQAKNFVQVLLMIDPEQRPSAKEALQHDWIRIGNTSKHSCGSEVEEMSHVVAAMETFAEYSKLKKLALMVIAHKATSEEIGFLRRMFDNFDRDLNGVIERADFIGVLEGFGYSEEEIDKMFVGCDLDGTGVIQYTEFLAATIESHGAISEEALAEAFDRMDCDDTGYISTHNLREILGDVVSSQFIEGIILEAESRLKYSESIRRQIAKKPAKDHFISYEEFMALWDQEQDEKRAEALQKIRQRSSTAPKSGSSLNSIQEGAPMSSVTFKTTDDADANSTSDISFETDPESISMFQGEKMMSVRKYADI